MNSLTLSSSHYPTPSPSLHCTFTLYNWSTLRFRGSQLVIYEFISVDLICHSRPTLYKFRWISELAYKLPNCQSCIGCLVSQQHASVSQGQTCHTEIEAADQTHYLTQSQYTDIRPTSPIIDPMSPGAWQSSHCSTGLKVTSTTRPRNIPFGKVDLNAGLPLSKWTLNH